MRYIQTGKVAEKSVIFNSVAKTEFEVNMMPALKSFLTVFSTCESNFILNDTTFVVYALNEQTKDKVLDLFKTYSKYKNSKKDEYGIWGTNSICDYFKKGADMDFWFCFEGGEAPWLVLKADKEADFLLYFDNKFFGGENQKEILENAPPTGIKKVLFYITQILKMFKN